MISASEIEKGLILDIEGEPYTVLDWRHVTEGRGKASRYIVDDLQLDLSCLMTSQLEWIYRHRW